VARREAAGREAQDSGGAETVAAAMRVRALVLLVAGAAAACSQPASPPRAAARADMVDAELSAAIAKIRAVDNHTHVNSTDPKDADSDALPLDGLPPFELPATVRPDNPIWIPAFKRLYGYAYPDFSEPHLKELRGARDRALEEHGEQFAEWVLDKAGTEVMLANRVAMGPGLAPPRFRWVSFGDALMLPLPTKLIASATPDRSALFPLEQKLLARYLADLHATKLPATLEEYQRTVVTPTLERQRQAGAVAVKFEAAYLRSLEFADADPAAASRVYAQYVKASNSDGPSQDIYRVVQDFLFRYIAREAGRLGMAVHIHSFEGAGGFYVASDSDPLLLESTFNDPSLRATKFVIIHGGGMYADHTAAMLAKANVYADMSLIELMYPRAKVAGILRNWLTQYPEKVLFGTDASPFSPDAGWDVAAVAGSASAREALGLALTAMIQAGEVTRPRAEEIAAMVLRTNAGKLYNLSLK
jgi:predicted TIM-barrel fold metal-dependent hydrolase